MMKATIAAMLVIAGLVAPVIAAPVVDNDRIYIWSDPFGDEYDNYAEVAPGDSVTVTVVVNDLNGSVDMTTGNTLVNQNWVRASNGARTGVWWDPAVIVGDTGSPDYVQADGVGTNFRQYWSPAGGTLYYRSYLGHYWGEHYEGAVVWVAEGRRLINFTFTIRADATPGTTTALGLNSRFFWSPYVFDPYSGYWFADQIDSDDPLAMQFYITLPPTLGDFDGDGDIDADDIDILCDNMGGDVGTYDVDSDGDVDEDDLTYLIENFVELQDGSGRVGTKQGDFNLDGFVNATDLAIMKGTFGTSGVDYADGNANCDELVNATDLAILKTNFGFVALTGGVVPEPMTISLLAMGALALLRRRSQTRRGGS